MKESYSERGRPSIDPELLLRILLIGYLYGITSERKLVEELRMHLAWRWFTGLGFDQEIPHHSTFSKNRHGRFQESRLFEQLFEEIVARCLEAGLIQGDKLSVDGSFIEANAAKGRKAKWWERLDSNHIIAFGTIGGTLIAATYLFYFITQHRQEHRPIVAFSRPIELLEPFTCDTEKGGEAHFGHVQTWIKNFGNAQAKNVYPYNTWFKIVPDERTGNRLIDDPVRFLTLLVSKELKRAPPHNRHGSGRRR